ncbi:MAG: SurA N-terminal domain-containing protein [Synergistaceae bacterium]|nr:SurA N-terminal domain-containing protein [Synergistaceae bacterium]
MMKFLRTQMKWIMAVIVVAFLLSTFLMYEGRSTRRTPGRNPDGTMSDYEVAQINGRSLMRSELEQRLRNYLSTYSTRSVTSIDMPALYRAVLEQTILESQLAKEVEEKGIRVTDAEADIAMKNYADTYFPTREMFYQVLANSGIKVDDYRKNLARQMASDKLIRDAIGEITISEDKAAEFYDSMKGLIYSKPEGFNMHMADFNTSSDAEAFRAEIAGGMSWDIAASGDVKGASNVTKSPVFLPLSALRVGALSVLASLDVGTVSPVFAVSSGDYAVALKTEHVEASVTPYAEVSDDIRTLLTQQEERSRLTAYESSLRQKASVVINDEELFASPASANATTESEDVVPEFIIEEVSSDEATEPEESEDVPAVVEVVSEEKSPEPEAPATTETVSEEIAPVIETPATDEPTTPETPATDEAAKSEDAPTTEPATETPATPETPATVEAVKSEEAPATEPATDELATPETPATVETAKSEEAPTTEAPATDEPAQPETPETVEAPKSEEAPATEPAKIDEPAQPETPATETQIAIEPEIYEITKSEDIPLQEDITEKISEDSK